MRDDIARLESHSVADNFADNLDRLLRTELRPADHLGCLYHLTMSLSNLVQVTQILVVATVSSFMLQPAGGALLSARIDNNFAGQAGRPIVVANVEFEGRAALEALLEGQGRHQDPIQTCALLEPSADLRAPALVTLPIFIMDGQLGHLNVFYVLNSLRARPEPAGQDPADLIAKFLLKSIPVKPLMSYQPSRSRRRSGRDKLTALKLVGDFKAPLVAGWLLECLAAPACPASAQLESRFTRCSLEYELADGQLALASDDLIALDLIEKHILRKATNQSIKLEVAVSGAPSADSLRHLISLQQLNLGLAGRLARGSSKPAGEPDKTGLLGEALANELGASELPAGLQVSADWLEESLRRDVEQLAAGEARKLHAGGEPADKADQLEASVFKELVCGFIIDALADHDRMKGARPSSGPMVLMRSRLAELLAEGPAGSAFVDRLLAEWDACRTQAAASPPSAV